MTTLDSSSSAESSMDDNGSNGTSHRHLETPTKANSFNTTATTTTANNNGHSRGGGGGGFRPDGFGEQEDEVDGANYADQGNAEVWGTFTENFRQVQSVLDRNRVLIQQVNENHQSKIHDNMVKNVALIQEINGNISKVVSLYSGLSSNFSSMFHPRNGAADAKSNNDKGDTAQA